MQTKVTTLNVDAFKDGILFSLTVRRPGVRVKVKDMAALEEYLNLLHADDGQEPSNAAVDVPKKAAGGNGTVKITKRIFLPRPVTKEDPRPDPYESAVSFMNGIKEKLCGRFGKALPSKIKEGLFIVRKDLVEEFETDLKAALEELHRDYIPPVLADYQFAKERARGTPVKQGGLGPLYREADYATAEEFCEQFSLEWQYLQLGIPDDLPAVLRQEAVEKLNRQFTEAAEEVKLALRESFADLINHASEKLKPSENGKQQIFRDSLLGNIAQFCEVFESRNLMGDSELAALVSSAKNVLTGLQPDRVRKFANIREEVKGKFDEIKAQLDGMLTTKKSRKFDLSED